MKKPRPIFPLLNNEVLIVPLAIPPGIALGLAVAGESPPPWPLLLHPLVVALTLMAWHRLGLKGAKKYSRWRALESVGARRWRMVFQSIAFATMACAATLMVQPWGPKFGTFDVFVPFLTAGALAGALLATFFHLRSHFPGSSPFDKLIPAGPIIMTVVLPIGGSLLAAVGGFLLFGLSCWNKDLAGPLAGLGLGLDAAMIVLATTVWFLLGFVASLLQVVDDKAILTRIEAKKRGG